MILNNRNIGIFLLSLFTIAFVNIKAQNSNIEKQYYQDSISLEKYKLMLKEDKFDSIGIELSNIDNAGKVTSIYNYNESMEDLRHNYDLQTLELENSIRNNEEREKIITCIIISIIITSISSILLYAQNRKLNRVREKWRVMQISAEIALRNKSTMLSNMSHEIKTPLNALIGFSDILSDSDYLDEDAIQECNEIIKLNSSLLQNLINDVIDMSRLNINDLRINIKACDLIDICRKTINTLQHIKQCDADIFLETDLNRLIIRTDAARIQQVLINLLVNATKFCKHGKIILKVELDNDIVYVSVTDTGTGIPFDKQHLVFERFAKVDEESHGTGLGLSICKLIITELKGKIWVDSTYNDGARFIFTLPII